MFRASAALLLVPAIALVASAQEKKPKPDLDDASIAAYEKLGARYGAFTPGDYRFREFKAGRKQLSDGMLPGFKFDKFPEADLPDVAEPFALTAHGYTVTDAAMKRLTNLSKLAFLDLCFSQVGDAGMATLAGSKELKALVALKLNNTNVSPAGLKSIGALKSLKYLDLSGQKIADGDLKPLKDLAELETLVLSFTSVTGAGLKDLKHLKMLATVHIDYKMIGDATLKALREYDLFHTLGIVSGADGKRAANADEITRIDFGSVTPITDEGFKELKGLKKLDTLRFFGNIGDKTLQNLREIGLLHSLTACWAKGNTRPKSNGDVVGVDLSYSKVTDAGLKEIGKFENLEALTLIEAPITDASVPFISGFKKLKVLYITKTKVTPEGAAALKKALPECLIAQ